MSCSLIRRTLVPGECVRVGRKPSAELCINRPYLSGLHCEVDVRPCPDIEAGFSCGLTDHSHNGTWLLPASERTALTNKAAVRMKKGERGELRMGDLVFLLSPYHKHCMELRFKLERGAGEGEFILRQLSPTEDPPTRKRGFSEHDVPPRKSRKLDHEAGIPTTSNTTSTANGSAPTHAHSSTPSPAHKEEKMSAPAHPHSSIPSPTHKEEKMSAPTHPHSSTPSPTHKECDIETTELEHCPHCLELFPLDQLLIHSDLCPLPHLHRHTSMEQCPVCHKTYPVLDLVAHVDACCGGSKEEVDGLETAISPALRHSLESHERPAGHGTREAAAVLDSAKENSQKYVPYLKECELKEHMCLPEAAQSFPGEEEQCQHCLEVFPLSELVTHSLGCPQRRDIGSLESDGCVGGEAACGEPMERCMHCFRDFPLSRLVGHSHKCEGDMLGPRGRFTAFLPSVHDMDPMALSVLNETQMSAVEYVMERSKVESESAYPSLKSKVLALGYTEKDLESTLQWIRRDAPIIVHINLDRVLRYLVDDSHYRNLFEVGTGGGSVDTCARKSWEDRIFNKLYSSSSPSERVKYGVLNIGDPRGVQSCFSYGDSFLQLKKVRLRTTFASADTSSSSVLLSCCEHYGNVLNQYSYPELQAILEVATRKQPFLQSNIISQYKEIQIHGPLCLSENVDCIVVNDRHASDPSTRELLDVFVERNKCNLLWMEPADLVGYPTFTPTHVHTPVMPIPAPTMLVPAPPVRRRRRRRRRGRHRDAEHW